MEIALYKECFYNAAALMVSFKSIEIILLEKSAFEKNNSMSDYREIGISKKNVGSLCTLSLFCLLHFRG